MSIENFQKTGSKTFSVFDFSRFPRLVLSIIETTFMRCWHILRTVKNVMDRLPQRHISCRQLSKTVDSTLTGTFWKRHGVNAQEMIKIEPFLTLSNETDRFLGCRNHFFAIKVLQQVFTVKFHTVFKLLRYRVNAI